MQTKKEIKDAYKQKKPRLGVFQIRNITSGKIFVEGSRTLDTIWNRHQAQLNFGSHPSETLQQDWKQYGPDNFVFEVIAEIDPSENPFVDDAKEVRLLEKMYLDTLQPYDDKGYNRRPRQV